MSNKTYDLIKTIALIATPVTTFIAAICSIWDIQYTTEITATLAAIDTLLGGIVLVANKLYKGKEEGQDGK